MRAGGISSKKNGRRAGGARLRSQPYGDPLTRRRFRVVSRTTHLTLAQMLMFALVSIAIILCCRYPSRRRMLFQENRPQVKEPHT